MKKKHRKRCCIQVVRCETHTLFFSSSPPPSPPFLLLLLLLLFLLSSSFLFSRVRPVQARHCWPAQWLGRPAFRSSIARAPSLTRCLLALVLAVSASSLVQQEKQIENKIKKMRKRRNTEQQTGSSRQVRADTVLGYPPAFCLPLLCFKYSGG